MQMGPQGGPSSRTLYADITLLQVSARGEDCFTGTQKRKKSPAAAGHWAKFCRPLPVGCAIS